LAEGEAETPAKEAGELVETSEETSPSTHLGRPKDFTDFRKAQVCMLIGLGMSQRQASMYLGFSPTLVSQTLRRDKKFARDVARATATATFNPLYHLIKASERNWRAAAWLLEHMKPHTDLADREARREARKAEKRAAEEAVRQRERSRQRQIEVDEDLAAMLKRMRNMH
jgi:hypothetical protein